LQGWVLGGTERRSGNRASDRGGSHSEPHTASLRKPVSQPRLKMMPSLICFSLRNYMGARKVDPKQFRHSPRCRCCQPPAYA
jgi:hypothetical protein